MTPPVRLACAALLALTVLAAACRPHVTTTPPAPVVSPPVPVAPSPAPDPTAWTRLAAPRPGEWRERNPGDIAASFDDYVASDPVRAEDDCRTLAFVPVGPFDEKQRATLDAAVAFTGLWFDLPVRVLPAAELTDDEAQYRLRPGAGSKRTAWQYRTGWFLSALLPDLRPEDAVVLIGVTMADIYPGAGWNYVFGEADLRRRVGVYSLVRYFPEFWGKRRDAASERLALLRTFKVVVHETGHTFGLEHCVTWACAMNGSNSLDETDGQPLSLCPDCLRKLSWNRGFDVPERYRKLAAFLDEHGLAEEAAWHRARAGEIR